MGQGGPQLELSNIPIKIGFQQNSGEPTQNRFAGPVAMPDLLRQFENVLSPFSDARLHDAPPGGLFELQSLQQHLGTGRYVMSTPYMKIRESPGPSTDGVMVWSV